jgi:hypothetical protein
MAGKAARHPVWGACLAKVFSTCGVMLGQIRSGAPATTNTPAGLSEPLF